MMRILLLLISVSWFGFAAAERPPPPGVPPIDSEDEARHVAYTEVLAPVSCLYGPEPMTIVEFEEFWRVTIKDSNSVGSRPCRTILFSIRKADGKILFENSDVDSSGD